MVHLQVTKIYLFKYLMGCMYIFLAGQAQKKLKICLGLHPRAFFMSSHAIPTFQGLATLDSDPYCSYKNYHR